MTRPSLGRGPGYPLGRQGTDMPAASSQSVKSSQSRMIFNWNLFFCSISAIVSNFSCLALCSFFFSILPTKRNLLTHLDTALVLAVATFVNVLVCGATVHKHRKLELQIGKQCFFFRDKNVIYKQCFSID